MKICEAKGVYIFIHYYRLYFAKESCYLPSTNIIITDKSDRIQLQSLRISLKIDYIIDILTEIRTPQYLIMTYKWGSHGASDQRRDN